MDQFAMIAAGLVLLLMGGESVVRGAVALARRLGVSELVVGLTLVGTLTSLPELLVSLRAAADGAPGLALGNAIGSNIANLLLILGAAAMVHPLKATGTAARRDGMVNVGAAMLVAGLATNGFIERWQGAALVLTLALYLVASYHWALKSPHPDLHEKEVRELTAPPLALPWASIATLAGLAALLVGAQLLVDGSVALARSAGLSEAVIGLTLVAIGTSFPELATSVVAAWRRHTDVAIGNAVGSCLFNSLGIVGMAALTMPLQVEPELAYADVWVMLAVSAMTTFVMVRFGRIGRRAGMFFLATYIVYGSWLWWRT